MRQKPHRVVPPGFRLRPPPPPDKRAMISVDTASEASIDPPPFINQVFTFILFFLIMINDLS